jgi:adenylate cyclase
VSWGFLRELVRRRVPSILGLYLAGGWGLLEFTGWAAGRFNLSNNLEVGLLTTWGLLLPAVTVAAWKWGRPGVPLPNGATLQLEPSPHPGPSTLPAPLHPSRPSSGAERRSVAVLPFVNMSGDPGDDYLGDGLSEEIMNALVKVPDLRVASRTSAFAYRGASKDVRAIGRELNVSSILEGSVQRSKNRIRVTTQLVSAADGYHLWSERFDGEMEDVFAIEDQIAEKVARALRVILNGQAWERAPRIQPSDIRAYEYYLRGHQFLLNPRVKSLGYAREMFERAIEVDTAYAPAWAGIAEAAALIHMNYPSRTDAMEEADRASQKALELAPALAEAHAARGLTLFLMQRPEEAEEAFREASRLDPHLFQARYFHGRACFQSGRMEEAAAEFKEAARLREDYQAAFFAAQSLEALGTGRRSSGAARGGPSGGGKAHGAEPRRSSGRHDPCSLPLPPGPPGGRPLLGGESPGDRPGGRRGSLQCGVPLLVGGEGRGGHPLPPGGVQPRFSEQRVVREGPGPGPAPDRPPIPEPDPADLIPPGIPLTPTQLKGGASGLTPRGPSSTPQPGLSYWARAHPPGLCTRAGGFLARVACSRS